MARYEWPAPPQGRDRPQERADHLTRFRPAVDPTVVTPLPRSARSRSRRAAPHTKPKGTQNLWFPIGPTTMTHGQAGGDPNVAGRISDLAVEPVDGLRLYAATAGGGTWFSADRGENWTPLDDFQVSDLSDVQTISSALSCGAIHVMTWGTQSDGSGDVVWVGTGEATVVWGGLRPPQPAGGGPGGGLPGGNLLGIGLLNRDPGVAGGAWQVVKGDPPSANPSTDDTLRGAGFFRIVADPGIPEQLVAATTRGLYVHPKGGSWARLSAWVTGFATVPHDVLLTRPTAGTLRIWVATASALWVAELTGPHAAPIDDASLTFAAVKLDGVATNPTKREKNLTVGGTRLALAFDGVRVFVLGRQAARGDRLDPPAALWAVDPTAALSALTAVGGTRLSGTPEDVFMSASDQSDYDMCVTAHPSIPGRVFIGGASVGTGTGWNGAIYRCDTDAVAAHPTYVGEGTHADIHVLRVGPASPVNASRHTVWVGCDGGVFRSDAGGDPETFAARNDGLAVLQPGYVACHPTNPGIVVAGFQDNGTALREGDGVWRQTFEGDGGGVVFDPAGKGRYFRQYVRADWRSSEESQQPVERRGLGDLGGLRSSEGLESDVSQFYSGADAVAHGGDTHLVIGSDRVWYSRDWGHSWVTLPSGKDPRETRNVDLAQDVLKPSPGDDYKDRRNSLDCCGKRHASMIGPGLITVKLSAAPNDSSAALVLRALAMYTTGITWLVGSRAASATGAFSWAPLLTTPVQEIKDPVAATDVNDLTNGVPMSFLPAQEIVSDLGVHDPACGTIGSVYVTTTGVPFGGPTGVPRDTLWWFDGTGTWVQTGLRNWHPNGSWTVPKDRVTAPALGVLVDPAQRDVVYVATSAGVVKGTLTISAGPTYHWSWERFMNGLPTAAVQDLSLFSSGTVRLLRAAVQSRGVWEVDLAQSTSTARTYLRLFATDTRRVLPTPLGGDVLTGDAHDPAHWDDSPDVVVDTRDFVPPVPPTEAQLVEIAKLSGDPTGRARHRTTRSQVVVHVLVHHRWSDNLPKGQVKVALLRHDLSASGTAPVSALWPGLVDVAGPAAAEPASLLDGWTKAAATLWKNPLNDVDTRLPRAVSFNVDLAGVPSGTAVAFLAVVMSVPDPISAADLSLGEGNTAQTADQLVMSSPHVAATSLEVD